MSTLIETCHSSSSSSSSTIVLPCSNETVVIPDDDYFEGPEKTLEVWFRPTIHVGDGKHPSGRIGLRLIPREKLEELLALVKCTILSTTQTDYLDSYVLSESSMFVSPFRFILKTCGRTTLLWAVPKILQFAREIGLTDVEELFFSRRHFGKPELQRYPHTSFDEEVKYLDEIFDGSAYTFGKVNSNDLWYLYTLNNPVEDAKAMPCMDKTLEVIMSHLDPSAMANFFQSDKIQTAADVERETGIAQLFPDAVLDGFLFTPCGYSVNGMMDEYYFTIHVTPQDGFSYVSFETDVPMEDYTPLIDKVVKIFRPGQFSVNLFVTERHDRRDKHFNSKAMSGYTREYNMMQGFEHYDLLFYRFVRNSGINAASRSRSAKLKSLAQLTTTTDGVSTTATSTDAKEQLLQQQQQQQQQQTCTTIIDGELLPTPHHANYDSDDSSGGGGSGNVSARQSPPTVEASSASASDLSDSESCEGGDSGSDGDGSR